MARSAGVEETHIHNLLAGGQAGEQALSGLSSQEAAQVQEDARAVFDSAFASTLKLSAAVAAAGAVVAFAIIPRLRAPPAVEVPVEAQVGSDVA